MPGEQSDKTLSSGYAAGAVHHCVLRSVDRKHACGMQLTTNGS